MAPPQEATGELARTNFASLMQTIEFGGARAETIDLASSGF
jgi:hypothetical protein